MCVAGFFAWLAVNPLACAEDSALVFQVWNRFQVGPSALPRAASILGPVQAVLYTCNAHRGQNRASDPLGLEL